MMNKAAVAKPPPALTDLNGVPSFKTFEKNGKEECRKFKANGVCNCNPCRFSHVLSGAIVHSHEVIILGLSLISSARRRRPSPLAKMARCILKAGGTVWALPRPTLLE